MALHACEAWAKRHVAFSRDAICGGVKAFRCSSTQSCAVYAVQIWYMPGIKVTTKDHNSSPL